jgi:hypothetical protein
MSYRIRRFGLLFVFAGATSVLAQSPDLSQLKAKLQQLEQMMLELKAEIAAAEQPPAAEQTSVAAQAVVPPAPQAPAKPQEPAVPTPMPPAQHIGDLTRTRTVANDVSDGAPRINNEVMDPALRGYFRLPGTGTLIKLGGFVKTDVFVDANQAGTYYGAYVPSSFPSSPQPHTVNATVSMRPSRFFAEFLQPTQQGGDGTVKGYLEFDFLGNYERTSFRLRQFYAQYKNVLVGQTWSAFGDPDAFPDTLEFEGPPGIIAMRQPMVRYTHPFNNHHSIGLSVERSGVDTPFITQATPVGSSLWPDLVGFYRFEEEHGHLQFAFLSRSVGGVIPSTTQPDLKNHVAGYGGSLSGVWGLGKSKDNIVFQFVIGKGISNYYNDNFGLGSDAGFNANGKLVATPTGSAEAGYQHHWSKLLRSTFSYGYLQINNTASDPGTNYHISHYATANIIVQPTTSLLFGTEYVYGSLERKNGFKWVAPRIQASITYYLNKYPKE